VAIGIAHPRKQYGSDDQALIALADINLDISPGEFVCIVGPSAGAGRIDVIASKAKHSRYCELLRRFAPRNDDGQARLRAARSLPARGERQQSHIQHQALAL
jgi:predicted ABC-type transport system involved in lysophospholipase L1 biosynthesis ATPase subunit